MDKYAKTRERILTSDEFVLAEYKRLRTAYGLKSVIRYHHVREEDICTESVAEHVFGIQVLLSYFLPLEDELREWDTQKIWLLTTYHDLEEVETGDTIGYLKENPDENLELEPALRVANNLPTSLQETLIPLLTEYSKRATPEAKFVKALDKIESLFHLYGENGKAIQQQCETTFAQHDSIKTKYIEAFPYMQRFNAVVSQHMKDEGYFAE